MVQMKPPPAVPPAEVAGWFADPDLARRFPPLLTVAQAADLLQVPAQTIYDWSSRGLLAGSRVRVGRHLRLVRDRLLLSFLHGTPNG